MKNKNKVKLKKGAGVGYNKVLTFKIDSWLNSNHKLPPNTHSTCGVFFFKKKKLIN